MTGRSAGARRLLALLLARTGIARLGDQMGTVIYVWAALESGGAFWAGVVGAAAFAPAAFGAALGGPLVARLGGPAIFLAAGIANAAGTGLLAWLLLGGAPAPWLIAAIVAASALLDLPAIVAAESRRPELARLARVRLFRLRPGLPAEVTLEVAEAAGARWQGRVQQVGAAFAPRRVQVYEPRERGDVRVLEAVVAFEAEAPALPLGTRLVARILPAESGR